MIIILNFVGFHKASKIREYFIKVIYYKVPEPISENEQAHSRTQAKRKRILDNFFNFKSSQQTWQKQAVENKVRIQCSQYLNDEEEDFGIIFFIVGYPTIKKKFNYDAVFSTRRRSLNDDVSKNAFFLAISFE